MARYFGWILGAMMTSLPVLGAFAPAQEALIPAPAVPAGAASVYRLTLEDAQRLALANNTGLTLGRLGVQEKSIAADAARRDYFPKLLGNFYYFHFNDNLGKVATFRTGTLGILPPGTRTIEAAVTNQDSTLTAITLAQPITKLIAVNAAVQLARADTVIAQAQLDKGTRDLLSGVAQAFHGMYGAQRIEAALNLQVQVAGRLAQINKNPEIRVAMIEAQQALLQVRSQISNLRNSSIACSGCLPARASSSSSPCRLPFPSTTQRRPSSSRYKCNPQVQEAMATVEKARAALKVANADFIPRCEHIRIILQSDGGQLHPTELRGVRSLGFLYILRLGQAKAREGSARNPDPQASYNVRATIEKVRLETVQAFVGYQQAQQAFGLANDMVQARKDAESRTERRRRHRNGKAATAKSELELIQAEIAYRVAHARLIAAIGNP